MKQNYNELPNGYLESINRGILAVRSFQGGMSRGKLSRAEAIAKLKNEIETADAIVIGAGAGLSTAAGFIYSGERFEKYFGDFAKRFGIQDMYSGGFYPFPDAETRWAWWARNIYINRYVPAPKSVYDNLLSLVKDKDYFVITTNVDHQFQKAGFDKKRLFYTQGDYGLFQSVDPKNRKTYDNEEWVMKTMEAQGFVRDSENVFQPPKDGTLLMRIPTELIPKCPDDGSDVTMNLRCDDRKQNSNRILVLVSKCKESAQFFSALLHAAFYPFEHPPIYAIGPERFHVRLKILHFRSDLNRADDRVHHDGGHTGIVESGVEVPVIPVEIKQ